MHSPLITVSSKPFPLSGGVAWKRWSAADRLVRGGGRACPSAFEALVRLAVVEQVADAVHAVL
jgi:hypothetical protein